jgi:putative oxidoreductase
MFWTLIAIARLLLGGAFVAFAVRNYMVNTDRLSGLLETSRLLQKYPTLKLPTTPRNVVLAGIGMQFVGGLLTAVGLFPALGGLMMIVFLIIATVLFHPAWLYSAEERAPHTVAVLMNTSLVGAFLMSIAVG